MSLRPLFLTALAAAALAVPAPAAPAPSEPVDPALFSGMRWRSIGPFRGGRVLAVAGVPSDPNVYYFGSVGGGVWKTTDAGRVWKPIFDGAPVASIGALEIAPSDPNVIYVGTGEADMRSDISFGDGVYKSADAGKTWKHIGLSDTRQIGRVLVDPGDPNVVLVAALGHAYGPNAERGVFRSEDGGRTWKKTLYKNEDTGAIDLAFDPDDARIVYAALWQTRRPPWSVYAPSGGPGSGLYRSADGGVTWKVLSGHGLPEGELGRIGLATSRRARAGGNRVWALIDTKKPEDGGLFRSEDGGASWTRVGTDPRILSRAWYFSGVTADPRDPETVYVANVSLYRSADGGKTFTAIKGAPGGDDYHFLWVDPGNPRRMIVGSDQGATVSVDGGETWSSWYNQPTGQFYHVATDNRFPYRVYGAQQDSGTASVTSRSDYGQISFRDWHAVGAEESGYILPDPRDPDVVYGGGPGGQLFRFTAATGQTRNISPWPVLAWGTDVTRLKYRFTWTSPIAFSPQDPSVLFLGSQRLLRTGDGGSSWTEASPDLTRHDPRVADPGRDRGVIYTIAPSPVQKDLIWAGTDNGLIQVTRDGGRTWTNVTPPGLPLWSKIAILEASHHDAGAAYAAVDRHRLDDDAPYILRTRDYGKSWTKITQGLSAPAFVNVVREDPARRGLLFAGTETGAAVSFDDGDHWQPLQSNLPPASVRDLAIRDGDLVAATHGRAFWILDDIAPLEEIAAGLAASPVHLFRPRPAVRARGNVANDTPLPPETPVGQNPPDGAILDYFFAAAPAGEVTLEVLDSSGRLVRRLSSREEPRPAGERPAFPDYWLKRRAPLPAAAGMNRFVWDLRYSSPPADTPRYGIGATIAGGVPELPRGPLVLPGDYTVRLSAEGRSFAEPLSVRVDPRVPVSREDLARQLDLETKIGEALTKQHAAAGPLRRLRSLLAELGKRPKEVAAAAAALDRKAAALEGSEFAPTPETGGFRRLEAALVSLAAVVDNADAAPTRQAYAVFAEYERDLAARLAAWDSIRMKDVVALNEVLREHGLPALTIAANPGNP